MNLKSNSSRARNEARSRKLGGVAKKSSPTEAQNRGPPKFCTSTHIRRGLQNGQRPSPTPPAPGTITDDIDRCYRCHRCHRPAPPSLDTTRIYAMENRKLKSSGVSGAPPLYAISGVGTASTPPPHGTSGRLTFMLPPRGFTGPKTTSAPPPYGITGGEQPP
jgi:hypothetical protein